LLDPDGAAAEDEPADFAYATLDTSDGTAVISAVDRRATSEPQAFFDGNAGAEASPSVVVGARLGDSEVAAADMRSRGHPSFDSDHPQPGSVALLVAPVTEPEDRQAFYVNKLF